MQAARNELGLSSTARDGGRASRPGPRAPLAGGAIAAALIAGVAAVLLIGGAFSAASHSSTGARYGGLPSWLPRTKPQVGRVLHASVAHPALSVEGEAISVSLAGGNVLATAVGPQVPEEGRFPVPPVTPATFLVTFASASSTIALNASQFTFIDEQGRVHHPTMTAVHGGVAPARAAPGHPVSVMLHDILPTGDGGLSWTPEGSRPIASWDYTVEID
jgi:hypothetical protein